MVRLWDPELGDIPAQELIAVAEAGGTVAQIDQQVLRAVCRFIRSEDPMRRYGLDLITVNLSALDLLQEDLVDKITTILKKGPEAIIRDHRPPLPLGQDLVQRLSAQSGKGIRLCWMTSALDIPPNRMSAAAYGVVPDVRMFSSADGRGR